MCSCKWRVSRVTEMFMEMCSEPIVWLSAHLHAHVRHPGHCTFTCTWCVLVNVQWSSCFKCSCNWAVSRMTDVCMKMCSEPIVLLSAHLHAHIKHTGHCMFTCTWCVDVNVQWSDCLMCWIIGRWAQWLMCAWKCAVSQLSDSLHIYMHTSDTRVTARLHALYVCMHVNVQWSDCLMCSCNGVVSPMTDECMKMCSESIVWLSPHIHAHIRHSGHYTFTST